MKEQRQESEWILSCLRSLKLKLGCIKDLCCYFFNLASVVDVVNELPRDGVISEMLCNDAILDELNG